MTKPIVIATLFSPIIKTIAKKIPVAPRLPKIAIKFDFDSFFILTDKLKHYSFIFILKICAKLLLFFSNMQVFLRNSSRFLHFETK